MTFHVCCSCGHSRRHKDHFLRQWCLQCKHALLSGHVLHSICSGSSVLYLVMVLAPPSAIYDSSNFSQLLQPCYHSGVPEHLLLCRCAQHLGSSTTAPAGQPAVGAAQLIRIPSQERTATPRTSVSPTTPNDSYQGQ